MMRRMTVPSGEVADVLPAECDFGAVGVRGVEVVGGVAFGGFSREADAGEALGGSEDDAAAYIVPSVRLSIGA